MPPPEEIDGLTPAKLKDLVLKLLEKVAALERTVAAQRDEIARLKGGPGRPNIKPNSKPSGMERATDPKPEQDWHQEPFDLAAVQGRQVRLGNAHPGLRRKPRLARTSAELSRNLGDDNRLEAAYRGGCRACQNLPKGAIRHVERYHGHPVPSA